MLIIITHTIFSKLNLLDKLEEEDLETLCNMVFDAIVQSTAIKLNYEIKQATWGLHVDATRPHIHMMVLYETHNSKTYLALSHKLRSIRQNLQTPLPDLEFKYSVHLDHEQDFDPTSLGYVYNELDNVDQAHAQSYRVPYSELVNMYTLARAKYKLKKKKEKTEKNLKSQYTTMVQFIELDLIAENHWPLHSSDSKHEKTAWVSKAICRWKQDQYKKGKTTTINVPLVKKSAISYLFYNNHINLEELLDL